eukprot:2097643-Alexandrium_andersonii.AAC.1
MVGPRSMAGRGRQRNFRCSGVAFRVRSVSLCVLRAMMRVVLALCPARWLNQAMFGGVGHFFMQICSVRPSACV